MRGFCVPILLLMLAPVAARAAPPPIAPLAAASGLPALRGAPLPGLRPPVDPAVDVVAARLAAALRREVPDARAWPEAPGRDLLVRAQAALAQTAEDIDEAQMVVVVDRNPAVQRLALVLARPGASWTILGGGRVSTGQGGRKDYYFTPVGVFAHTDGILDFRAEGTYNENNIRGLGTAGMRVWDFGWQWAIKGWRSDGEGGDIRLQMHATDPDALEQRLGHPASEGCVRVSSAMNRFLDRHGILDRDYERAALSDASYRALLGPEHAPTPLAGRLLIVVDSRLPADAPPTAASRPADVMAGPG